MRRSAFASFFFAAALGVSASTAAFADALFVVGPDAVNAPTGLNQLPTATPVSAAFLVSLGDGSIGFNGGLAYNTGDSLLYSIANDALGNSTLYTFTPSGMNVTSVALLGVGFNGGLAYDSAGGLFYAIANDIFGASTLYEVTSSGVATALGTGPIGFGFYGGLTFDADDGLLYAIASDAIGFMRSVVAIDVTNVAATVLFDLGDGSLSFNGGLAYDDAADLFYVVGNDSMADSMLFSFTSSGAASLAAIGGSFGQGFLNVGLALAPEVTPPPPTVSEPPTLALIGMLAIVGLARRRASTRRAADSLSVRG